MTTCPYCHTTERQVKAGNNPSGSQRHRCMTCGRKYTPEPNPNGYPEALRKQVVLMCFDGQSFRSIARKLEINPQTVVNWVNDYVARSSRAIYHLPKS